MKTCARCHEQKELSEFYERPRNKGGHRYSCKECEKKRYRIFYVANSARIRERTRQYHADHREERADWYQDNKEMVKARTAAWAKAHPKRRAFSCAKKDAKKRGLEFLMTRTEWVNWWGDDYAYRGNKPDDLNMCRYDDEGPYRIGNIYKASKSENNAGPRPLPVPNF